MSDYSTEDKSPAEQVVLFAQDRNADIKIRAFTKRELQEALEQMEFARTIILNELERVTP